MSETILKAIAREAEESPKKVRAAGFVPAVLNGKDIAATSVKFEAADLKKVITKHGSNAKIWIELGNEKKFGYIMELQRPPLGSDILHVTVKLLGTDEEIKIKLPIIFQGNDLLGGKKLQLNVNKAEIDVQGKATLMPDSAVCDVTQKDIDDTITISDFNLPEGINVLDADDEIYAVVKTIHEKALEEPEAQEEAEEEKEAGAAE